MGTCSARKGLQNGEELGIPGIQLLQFSRCARWHRIGAQCANPVPATGGRISNRSSFWLFDFTVKGAPSKEI